jgi:hypothetical protein
LHYNRAGHREAGRWLAENARPGDVIIDPYCWAHYYAGWVFLEGKIPQVPPGFQPATFAVIEHSGNPHSRLPMLPRAAKVRDMGKLVFHCPLKRIKDNGEEIHIYKIEPEPPPPRKPPGRRRSRLTTPCPL